MLAMGALTLKAGVRIEPVKPFSVEVKVPMVAMVMFPFCCFGPLHCGLDDSLKGRGRSDRTCGAGTTRRAVRRHFLVSRGMAGQPPGDESFVTPLQKHERGVAVLDQTCPIEPAHGAKADGERHMTFALHVLQPT
jgi:hypothetical protein